MITFDTETKAHKTCNWLNSFMDEQETGVQFEIAKGEDGKYIIVVSQL